MGAEVNLSMHTWVRGLCLLALAPAMAFAQAAPQAPSSQPASGASSLWFVAGGAFATLRGDCQTCEEDFPYRHSGAVLVDVGYRANPRMDVGAEVYWMPIETSQGTIRTTHIDAVAQFVENLRSAKFDEMVPEDLLRRLWTRSRQDVANRVAHLVQEMVGGFPG